VSIWQACGDLGRLATAEAIAGMVSLTAAEVAEIMGGGAGDEAAAKAERLLSRLQTELAAGDGSSIPFDI
jgi:hypothetical protein